MDKWTRFLSGYVILGNILTDAPRYGNRLMSYPFDLYIFCNKAS